MEQRMSDSGFRCNPLSLENYPLGFLSPSRLKKEGGSPPVLFQGPVRDFREMADPEVLYDNGKWYLFASCAEAYVSSDMIHWEYQKILFEEGIVPGYAPTVTRCAGQYLFSSSFPFANGKTQILQASSPLGPYRSLGTPVDGEGNKLSPPWLDPMLFTDEDGRLYAYWGFGGEGGGIYGIELEKENPVQGIGKAQLLYDFSGELPFERTGENHEMNTRRYVEGESMFRHNGEYYLQYCAGGTQYRSYCVGVLRGKNPLGPFTAQPFPAAEQKNGRICGTGHGSWCRGPDGRVWQFYTCLIRRVHLFERRIGMDPVQFDPAGNAHVEISQTPRLIGEGAPEIMALSVNKNTVSSGCEGTCYAHFAVDDCTHTWWMPEKEDPSPFLEVDLGEIFRIHSCMIQWAEEPEDQGSGPAALIPEPARYKVEFFAEKGQEVLYTLSRMENHRDLLTDFQELDSPCAARYVRLQFCPVENGSFRRGVNLFTVFGLPFQ